MRTILASLMVVVMVIMPVTIWAAHPLITDDTGTQGEGKFQLEVNGEYAKDSEAGVKTTAFQLGTTLAAGVHKDIDIIIGIPYISYEVKTAAGTISEQGFSDVVVEAKWRFFEKDGLSFALKPGLIVPTGDETKGLGAGKTGARVFFIATKELEPWAFHVNIGYIRNENKLIPAEEKNLWHVSTAAEYTVKEGTRLVGNIGIEKNPDPAANNDPAFLLFGVIHSPKKDIDLDAGVKVGLTDSEADLTLLAGVTLRF